ncbi:hypothetical protein METHP14_20198 [Pseudomonas sp. P14-2025]
MTVEGTSAAQTTPLDAQDTAIASESLRSIEAILVRNLITELLSIERWASVVPCAPGNNRSVCLSSSAHLPAWLC